MCSAPMSLSCRGGNSDCCGQLDWCTRRTLSRRDASIGCGRAPWHRNRSRNTILVGMFLGSMEELRADVVRNGLGVIEGGRDGLMRSD